MISRPTPIAADEALILHTLPYGDNDLIMTLLGQHCGRVNVFARSGRTSKKRFGTGVMPGMLVTVQLQPPVGDSELWRLKEITGITPWPWLDPQEVRLPIKLAGAYLLDGLKCFTQAGTVDDQLYSLAILAMRHLHSTTDVVEYLVRFQVRLLILNGICPDFLSCHRCGAPLGGENCWPYGEEIVGNCCRRILPVDPLLECSGSARLALVSLLQGGRPTPHTLDLAALSLTRQLLSCHFQKRLKSADLFEKMVR